MACQIPDRGDSQQVLLYKIASCLAEGGGLGAFGVASFNGRTGIVTLTAADVSTALGCTPLCESDGDARYVLKTGDSMTGALSIDNGVLVANDPALELSQTWNNAAVTFTGLLSNVTNTASNSDSNLFNFQSDGIDRFRFATIGQLFATRQDATNSGVTFFQRKRGNAGGATNAVASDATIGSLTHSGWNGAAYVNGSRISGVADENWTAIANGSRIDLYTTPSGSTSEQISLRLSSTGQALFRDGTAALPALSFQSDTNTGIFSPGADTLAFSTGGSERVRIDSAGFVGIGTTNPLRKFVIQTDFATPVTLQALYNADTTDGNGVAISFRADTSGAGATSFVELAGIRGQFDIHNHATRLGSLRFFTAPSGAGIVERLTILGSGNIGVGTSTPSQGLTLGTGLALAFNSGANQRAGDAVLVAGTVTVANTTVTANTRVFLTRKVTGGTIGFAVTYTVIASTSFTITSDNVLDTSTYSFLLIEVP